VSSESEHDGRVIAIASLFVRLLFDCFKPRQRLEAEILVLRHQLNILQQRAPRRLHVRWADRALFIWLYRRFPRILDAIIIVRPETVVRWHRLGFAAYMVPRQGRPLQSWKTFLRNHAKDIASIDLFVVPTIAFRRLFVCLVLGHQRRQLLGFAVTERPTAEWLARQITEAFPWDTAPKYLIRGNDRAFGGTFQARARAMRIRDQPTSYRSPWQNGHSERLIGSVRRECADHLIAFNADHLRRILVGYANYYNEKRTHVSLGKDTPCTRLIERIGEVVAHPMLGGLHHRYARI
jgi:transposase InsO family protein